MKLIPTAIWTAALATYLFLPKAAAADFQMSSALDGPTLNTNLKALGYQVRDLGKDIYAFDMYYNKVSYTVDAVISDSRKMVYVQTPLINASKVTAGMAYLKRSATVSPYFFAIMGDNLYLIRGLDNRGLTKDMIHQAVDDLLMTADKTRDLW